MRDEKSMDRTVPIDAAGRGWIKPRAPRSILELRQLIAEKESELQALRDEVFNVENGPRLEAVARIRNIMRAQQLTLADIAGRPEESLM